MTADMAQIGKKHAYLIMCHNNFENLERLLLLLDNTRNDIYIHVDKKVHDFDTKQFDALVKYSKLTWTQRICVNWGGFSQIKAELILLTCAVKEPHSYYHLLSGSDLPIKPQKYIHRFFDENDGKEFIWIGRSTDRGYDVRPRIGQYHFFQEIIGRNPGRIPAIMELLERASLILQRKIGVDRTYGLPVIYKGANWFSITHNLAAYVLSQEQHIKKVFGNGLCADELFLQTVAMESPYAENIVRDNKRLIDWNRGQPYTWKMTDFDELCNSNAFFARKFDASVDDEIIEEIFHFVKNQ